MDKYPEGSGAGVYKEVQSPVRPLVREGRVRAGKDDMGPLRGPGDIRNVVFLALGHVGLELRRGVADDHYSTVLRTGEQTWTGGEGGEYEGGLGTPVLTG